MISSVAWVPRGCAVENPVKFEPTEDELALARAEAEMSSMALDGGAEDAEEGDGSLPAPSAPPAPAAAGVDSSGLPADLRMDDYDDDDEDMSYAAFANSVPRSDLPDIEPEASMRYATTQKSCTKSGWMFTCSHAASTAPCSCAARLIASAAPSLPPSAGG